MKRLFYLMALLLLGIIFVSAQDEQVWLYGGGVYKPGDKVRLEYNIPPGSSATLGLYRILNPEKVLELGGPQDFQASDDLKLKQINNLSVRSDPEQYWGEASFNSLAPGMYFAQLEGRNSKSATLILVSDLSMVVKSDQNTILAYTASSDGTPRKAKVYLVRTGEGQGIYAEGLANDEGITEFTKDLEENLVVAAKFGETWAFSSSYWSAWALQKTSTYLHTDRPVYRPGHLVYFKGTSRSASGLRPLVNQDVQVVISDPDGNEIYNQTLKTDDYGSFNGELLLSAAPPLGYYNLTSTIDSEISYGSFEVQEFQKPEYRVTVTPDKDVAIQGEKAIFTVKGEYLFGGAVTGGKVSYAVMRQPYYRWYPYFYYDSMPYYGDEVVIQGEGVLNEKGELVVTVPLDRFEQDYQLTLQAGVTDEARREISASSSITVYRSGIVLNVRAERYAYKAGETALITVEAQDIEGNPVRVPFVLDTERYFWDKDSSRSIKGQSYRGETLEDGTATINIPFERQGSYTLTATAKDSKDRETTASESVWVSGDDYWYWAYDGLSLRADKPEYKIGETARIIIQSPIADAYALITQEGQEISKYEMVKLNGSVLTYELPVTDSMTPNHYVGVTIIGDGTTYYDVLNLNVPPTEKYLNVEITSDSDTYKPGEEGTFEVRVSDPSGKGIQSQLTLGIVDEGIYLVRPENATDIKDFFYAQKSNLVGTDLSDWFYFGGAQPVTEAGSFDSAQGLASPAAPRGREAMNEAVFAQSKSEFKAADVREDFRDTILWLPTLETDENGLATAKVKFPDNLTEWRVTARAISLTDQVGQNTYSVKTTLPVIARLAMPRFLIRGDSASLRVVGQSNLENDAPGQLSIIAEGLDLVGNPLDITLPAGGRVTTDYLAKAAQTGIASVTASALSGEASDAMKLPLPILPHGIRSDIAWADSGSSNWLFTLPENTDLLTTGGTLYLTPSLAAAVSPALSYLAGYPYGCTEQTMSRFYPSVLAKQAGDLAKLPTDVAENLDDIIAKGLERIYNFQHDDGGWGFWQYDSSSPFITAYVVNGLLDAQAAGYTMRSYVLESALAYLENMVNSSDFEDYRLVEADAKAYGYYALAKADRAIDGLDKLLQNKEMSSYGLALSALAFAEVKDETKAQAVMDTLISKAKVSEQIAHWDSEAPRYYWNDDSLETTAYALEALVKLRPNDALIPKVVNYLLLERDGSYWRSTKETAAIIKAALKLAETTGESNIDYQVVAKLNGTEVFNKRITGQSADGVDVPLENFMTGENKLELTVTGQGTLYASANTHYFAEQESYSPQTEHFRIKRTYEKLTSRLDPETQSYIYDRDLTLSKVNEGDYVLVTVQINPQDAYRYVMVNDPLPAGFRVVEDDSVFRVAGLEPRYGYDYYGWNYWYDGREVHDERVDFYFTYLNDTVTFTYILRAETPGSFAALPTQAWLMYEPDIRGISNDAVLSIH
jgi:alpha-2-macroglobulin